MKLQLQALTLDSLLSVGVSGGSYGMANAGPDYTSFTLWHECDRTDSKEGKTET